MEKKFFQEISIKPEFEQLLYDLDSISSYKIIPRPYPKNLTEHFAILAEIEKKLNKYFTIKLKSGFHRIVVIIYYSSIPMLVLKFPLFPEFTNTSISESNYIKQSIKLDLRYRFPSFFKLIENKVLITSYAQPITEQYFLSNYESIYEIGSKMNICDIEARNIGIYKGDWIFIDWGYELTIGFFRNSHFPKELPPDLKDKFKK